MSEETYTAPEFTVCLKFKGVMIKETVVLENGREYTEAEMREIAQEALQKVMTEALGADKISYK